MLTICTWKWIAADGSSRFDARHVNTLAAAFRKQLRMPHELVCVTDDATGIDPSVRIVPLPPEYRDTPRCRRRMRIFDRDFAQRIGRRILSIDLDMVLVGDMTPILDRDEPLVCWQVQHAKVFSGSFILMDAGVLHPLWERFRADPDGFPRTIQPRGTPSDQAMLNWYVADRRLIVPHWTERDGFVTYYGAGYERFEHLGIGPSRTQLPPHARIVVLGSDDLHILEGQAYPWVREHYAPLLARPA